MFEKFAEDVVTRCLEKLAALETKLIDLDKDNKQHMKTFTKVLDEARKHSILGFRKDGVPLPDKENRLKHTKKELQDTLNNEFNRIKLLQNEDGDLVGGAVFRKFNNKNDYALSDFGILPKYRRQGYGKELLDKVMQTEGLHSMELNVAASNEPALKLYESMGFKPYRIQMIKHNDL